MCLRSTGCRACTVSLHIQETLYHLPLSSSNNYFTYVRKKRERKDKEKINYQPTKAFHKSNPCLSYASIYRSFKIGTGSTDVPMARFIISFDRYPVQLTLIPSNVPMYHTESEHFLMPIIHILQSKICLGRQCVRRR